MDINDGDTDKNWTYLSDVLKLSNSDEDLREDVSETEKPTPKTSLEEQIQRIATPDAELTNISKLRPGKVHLHGYFTQASGRYLRQGLHITEAVLTDDSASVRVVWFNQPYRAAAIKRDVVYEVRGNYSLYRSRFQISNAKIRPLSEACKPFERGEKG